MKKVLIITYAFPPSNSVAVHRILRLGKWLPAYGWEPFILTTKYRYQSRTDYDNMRFRKKYFKNVYEVSSKFEYFLTKICNSNTILSKFFRYLCNFIVPDRYFPWFFSAVNKGIILLQKNKIDVIWATLNPYTDGLIGAYLSRKTNVPLLIDYRDPWTLSKFHNKGLLRKFFNKFIEKEMLKYANAICTTSDPMSKLFIDNEYFPKDKTFTITNSYDDELQYANMEEEEVVTLSEEKFNISYIGSFYGDRQPYTFIRGLSKLIDDVPDFRYKVQVNFIGNKNYKEIRNFCKEYQIIDIFSFKGIIKYSSAINYLKKSDLLLLINGEAEHNNVYIPGKLFDYLVVRKPILFIGSGQPEKIINKIGIGECVSHNDDEIYKTLKHIVNNISNYHPDETELLEFHSINKTGLLTSIFISIM